MEDEKVTLWCTNCNKAFTAFLTEMAEHNGKVTCPDCHQARTYSQSDIIKSTSGNTVA